jgi:hypothetical protein
MTYTAFAGQRRIAAGAIEEVAIDVQAHLDQGGDGVLIFEDQTGQQIDLDLRGTPEEAVARLLEHAWLTRHQDDMRTGPGRPKFGVTSREVSLLPRHWDWLNTQQGGASGTLRRLVDEKMKATAGATLARQAHDAATKFMWTMAGNLPDFEEASRAFSRREYDRFLEQTEAWPTDLRDHIRTLAATAQRLEHEATL